MLGFEAMEPEPAELDVYGLHVIVAGDWPEVIEAVADDVVSFTKKDPRRLTRR